jgi:ribonuclease HI
MSGGRRRPRRRGGTLKDAERRQLALASRRAAAPPPAPEPHPVARVVCDGGSRGNPGPAAIAAVVSDPDGRELLDRGEYIGEATNNVAEYRALLLGLELARELGAREVDVINDSELIARQVGGQYKVKHAGLRPLFLEATAALRSFDRWSLRNVPRAENARADALVNEALDEAAGR